MGQVIPFVTRVSAGGDWSAEERARLAELGERLAAAGLRVEVIYGATEDGDPWCVVKDDNEEVLIHVARIGGAFVIHYAVDDSLRQGEDLPAILAERLAWEQPGEVVTPFSRQAQSLLVLIVATAFFYESARHGGDGPHFTAPTEPAGEDAHLAAQAPPAHLVDDALMTIKALHADAAVSDTAATTAGLSAGASPEWRTLAAEDEAAARADHGGAELSLARFTPGAALPAIANLDVAAPAAASPLVVAFDDHARPAPVLGAGLSQTMSVESVSDPHGPVTTSFRPTQPERKTPQTEDHPVAVHWVEVDLDGDGRPDLRVAVPDEVKPSREPEPAHVAPGDHAAAGHETLSVGHSFEHSLIA